MMVSQDQNSYGWHSPSASPGQLNGNDFTTGPNSVSVTQLGYIDHNLDGLNANHQVGLWDVSGNLLGSVTVPAGTGATLQGNYRYATLASPITLDSNAQYVLGALTDGDDWPEPQSFANNFTSPTFNSYVSFGASYTFSATLAFPNNFGWHQPPDTDDAVNLIATLVASAGSESTAIAAPATASADNSATITVTIKDGSDTLLAGKEVILARTGGSGTGTPVITGNPGTTDTNGIASFTVACTTPGVYVYTATNVTDSVGVQQTATVTVTFGSATTLGFTEQPGDGGTGAAFLAQPKVTLQDAHGNAVTGMAQDVTLAIQHNAGPGGVLSGTKTVAVDTTTGVATFSALSIDLAGMGYTLTATGSTVATTAGSVVSTAFYVVAPGSPPPGYTRILTITLSGYVGSSTLSNFPVLVQIGTGISGFAYSDFLSGTNDIRFTDTNGIEIPYEIDTWNTSGNSLIWVRVPSLSGNNTVINMYYGKRGDSVPGYTTNGSTWSNGFQAVWHLNTAATSTADSSGNGHNAKASAAGAVTTSTTTAAIGTAGDFTGNGWLVVPASNRLSFPGDFTLSAWVNYPGGGNHEILGNWNNGYLWGDNGSNLWLPVGGGSAWGAGSVSLPPSQWHYLTVTRTGSTGSYTFDGNQVYTWTPGAKAVDCSLNDLCIGNGANGFGDGNHPWGGYLDEVRTAAAARSPDWIRAEYNNQLAPDTFASITLAGATPSLTYLAWTLKYPAATLTDPGADYDHDGLTNQQEYAFGLDPTSGKSCNPIRMPFDKATGKFSYTRTAGSTLTYTVWTSTNLKDWAEDPTATASQTDKGTVGGIQTVEVTVATAPLNARLFVRVQTE